MPELTPHRSFILKATEIEPFWKGEDVAEVRVILSDLAVEFNAPMLAVYNAVGLFLTVPGIGPLAVIAEIIEERALTSEELDSFCYSYQCLNLFVDRSVEVSAVKQFTRSRFPSWAEVCFFDEGPRPPVPAYQGPSTGA